MISWIGNKPHLKKEMTHQLFTIWFNKITRTRQKKHSFTKRANGVVLLFSRTINISRITNSNYKTKCSTWATLVLLPM